MAGPYADVAIVGAGPAGAATALFAARSGRRVVVVDRAHFPRDKACGEGLMPPGRKVLADLGLETDLICAGAPRLDGLVIGLAGGGPSVRSTFPRAETGLGVRRLRFDALLADQLGRAPQIEFSEGVAVERVGQTDGLPSIQTSAGAIRVRYVVVADGLRSGVRRQLGWTHGPRPPHRYGVVGHWHGAFPPDAWIRLTVESGFESYRAPVGPDEQLLALLCDRTRMAAFGRDLTGQYRSRVRTLHPDLDQAELSGEVTAIGPFRYRARTVARDGIFLVGDASGFVDPITGEGLASGLAQAQAFAAALDRPHPEAAYREMHRRLTQAPWRLTTLLVYLATSPGRTARAVRGMQARPSAMQTFLGINLGYWGFGRVTPREWVALLAGR